MATRTTFTLIYFLLLLSYLHNSHGSEDPQVYDIDYRGPETHPTLAPPTHFHGRPWTHRRSFKEPPKFENSRDPNAKPRGEVEGIHG